MFAAFLGGGVGIIDCTDLRDMKLVGHVCWTPPFFGKTHTAWPLGDRPYLIVTDEAHGSKKFWDSQFMWVVDIRTETNPMPVATWFPERKPFFDRPGRFGAHNVLEYMPSEGPWKDLVFITYFSAGLRAVDVSDPLKPREVGSLPSGAGRRDRGDPVERYRLRRARPDLPGRSLGNRHAYSGIHRLGLLDVQRL